MSGYVLCPNCSLDVSGIWLTVRDSGEPYYLECSVCPGCDECIAEDDWEIIEDESE